MISFKGGYCNTSSNEGGNTYFHRMEYEVIYSNYTHTQITKSNWFQFGYHICVNFISISLNFFRCLNNNGISLIGKVNK